jgi:hypothetical protein
MEFPTSSSGHPYAVLLVEMVWSRRRHGVRYRAVDDGEPRWSWRRVINGASAGGIAALYVMRRAVPPGAPVGLRHLLPSDLATTGSTAPHERAGSGRATWSTTRRATTTWRRRSVDLTGKLTLGVLFWLPLVLLDFSRWCNFSSPGSVDLSSRSTEAISRLGPLSSLNTPSPRAPRRIRGTSTRTTRRAIV